MDLMILVYVLLIIAFAKAMGELVTRVNQPAIVGEMLAGIVLGPYILGEIFSKSLGDMYPKSEDDFLSLLADLGMLFLMLYSGLQFSTEAIRSSSRLGASIAVTGIAIPMIAGYFVGSLFGYEGSTLAFIALAMSVTALPVTLRILVDLEVMKTKTAETITSAALITDVLLMLGLSLVLASGDTGESISSFDVVLLSIGFILFFVLALLIGKYIVPYVYRLLKWMRTGEAAFAVAIGFAIAFAILADGLGLPAVIGAFIAGLLLRQTGKGLKTWDRVEGILSGVTMGFFAPIFFVLIGFSVNFDSVSGNLPLLLAVVSVAVAGKIVGSYVPARALRVKRNEALAIASMMMGKGAMELVFARIAFQNGLIKEDLFSVLVLMAFISTMLAPVLFKHFYNKAVMKGEIQSSPGSPSAPSLIEDA
jgi:Kef-type K+ transport system membrane component KefB